MATQIVIYTVVHQPRRIKLPAQPIPSGASPADIVRCVFDEPLNEHYFRKVARTCYYPATQRFLQLADAGMKLSVGLSLSFIRQAQAWDPVLLDRFGTLLRHPNCELVGVEPYHSFLFLLDARLFVERMRWMREDLERIFSVRPRVTDTTELCMSAALYDAVDEAGFDAGILDGRAWVMGWREPTHLYHYGGRARLFCRHTDLSDDVGFRFSNRSWPGYPLYADRYAGWLRETWGDYVLLGWDFETFGEHQSASSGIFEFLAHLPGELARRGAGLLTLSEALDRFGSAAYHLPLPVFSTTWAGDGSLDFFLGNPAQQALFQLMLSTYSTARLTGDPDLLDLALWLAQSDNLHLIQWFGASGAAAEVSAYFTPREWWPLGPDRIIVEQQRVYTNALRAMEPFLPVRRRPHSQPLPAPLANERITREPEPAGIEVRY